MSWEVWGTPPDPEPARCPMCGEESHEEGCELGKMQARAVEAERKLYYAEGRIHALERDLVSSQGCVSEWVAFGSNVTEALGLRVMSPKMILAEIERQRASAKFRVLSDGEKRALIGGYFDPQRDREAAMHLLGHFERIAGPAAA